MASLQEYTRVHCSMLASQSITTRELLEEASLTCSCCLSVSRTPTVLSSELTRSTSWLCSWSLWRIASSCSISAVWALDSRLSSSAFATHTTPTDQGSQWRKLAVCIVMTFPSLMLLISYTPETCTRNLSPCTRNLYVCRSILYKFFLVQVSCNSAQL